MSTDTSVAIETRLVACIAEALLTIYAVQADALHHATNGHLSRGTAFDELDHARRALWATEAALDGVGWTSGHCAEPAELTGPPELVHDALVGAVIAAADRLADTCRDYTAARAELTAVRDAYEHLTELHTLFARYEESHAV
jgi:hypothetical protein